MRPAHGISADAISAPVISEHDLQVFQERLGIEEPAAADIGFLTRLHERFLFQVPFENLENHLGRKIVLDIPSLLNKIVRQKRGGFCYELNGLFHAALTSMGFHSTLISARVWNGERLGPDRDHMALIVDPGERYLVDVGFGDNFYRPLVFEPGMEQEDPNGTFRIRELEDGAFALEQRQKGGFELSYRFDPEALELADFEAMCTHHQTSPESHFTQKPVCSIARAQGRDTLTRKRFLQTRGEERREVELKDWADLESHLSLYFGIQLDLETEEIERLRSAFF